MICPNCGAKIVGKRRRCDNCGTDIAALDKLRKMSNRLYNEGLEMASVRDLSGAVLKLQKSLEVNKENIEARNLLGLVYYELGESTAAICQWVISTNLKKEDNDAERLLRLVQADSTEYQNVNSAIRKYNIALDLVKNGNEDMAVIQLKKVTGLNPHFVKAHLLLALIYIKNCEYERAKKLLKHVLKIDVGNVTARRYINEIKVTSTNVSGKSDNQSLNDDYDFTGSGSSKKLYTEDKPNILAVITFFIGIAIGIALVFVLAVPNIKTDIRRVYEAKERELGADVSAAQADKSSLESKIRILENENADLKSRLLIAEQEPEIEDAPVEYAPFLQLYADYLEITDRVISPISKGNLIGSDEVNEINRFYGRLLSFDMSVYDDENAKALYSTMIEKIGMYATGTGEEPEATPTPAA